MESFDDDDELTLSFPENPSYTVFKTKLKRLKKTADTSVPQSLVNSRVPDNLTMPISPVIREHSEIQTVSSDAMVNEGFGEETGPTPELDPLFAYRSGEEILSDPYEIETDVREVRGEKNEVEVEVVMEESKKENNVKRRLSLDKEEEDLNTRREKKRKYRKLKGPDGVPKESVREGKRLEKARKAELEHLHAESQRLLRETRDASFKPAQLIQKPISSVLEKIRLRKLEIMKSSKILSSLPSVVDADSTVGSDCNSYPVNGQIDIKETDRNAPVAHDVGAKGTHRNLTSITQANKNGPQLRTGGDNLINSQEVSPPSCPPSLKIDGGVNDDGVASYCDFDVSSSEEDSDKENVSRSVCYVMNNDSSPKHALAKAFLDDEAEEEDDSDCDLLRFQENEEENETDEDEELNELIATGYEEAPMDQEKRNELHQKWLEQQDAAETDNVLQRLKAGCQRLRKPTLIHGDYGDYGNYDESDNDNDEDNDEAKYKRRPIDTSHQNLKKAKQMISHMFADANNVYIPSDDEETEKNVFRHHILEYKEEPSYISPLEDESSQVFGLIKKMNIAPITKKKKASTPLIDSPMLSGNSNSSSKSFRNRAGNSLPPSHKQRSISVRTFIFSRDDSNSRSNISSSEINSEMVENESVSGKNSMKGKFSSQLKSSMTKRVKQAADSQTGPSLYNLLRQSSSIEFESKSQAESQAAAAAHKFSAFRLRRNSKMDSRT